MAPIWYPGLNALTALCLPVLDRHHDAVACKTCAARSNLRGISRMRVVTGATITRVRTL
jgi:hypothetical protein